MGNEIFEEIKRKYKKSNKYMLYVSYEDIGTLLNLIEKQFKEIEELKKPKYVIDFKTNEITKLTNDFVSKDKIKAKIEEVKDGTYDAKIVLESLLENKLLKTEDSYEVKIKSEKELNKICKNLENRLNQGITKIPDYDITADLDAYLKLLDYKKGE